MKALKVFLSVMLINLLIGEVAGLAQVNAEVSLDALAYIESSNNPRAINKDEGSYGLFQISPIALKDFNERVGSKHTVKNLMREETNAHIAIWMLQERLPQMLRYYKKDVSTRNLIIAWNCGITCLDRKKLPKTTLNYLSKYRRLTGEKV